MTPWPGILLMLKQENLHLSDGSPTEKEPREFEIDPTGRFVIAAGESSGKIALYRIHTDGSLNLLKTYEVGKMAGMGTGSYSLVFEPSIA